MITVMVAALIAFGTAYAVGTILVTFRHYRGAVSALREMLGQCQDEREVRIVIHEWNVSETASVFRPDFTRSKAAPNGARALLAAA